ncbi:MAG: hypothetical protein QE271_06315 [Bacteriovoracaceae bacterium]|nr:hypothetical protein [Bacteriovoracaceae bacterium]
MTMLFGEYLVEKGHLSKSALLAALVMQIKSIPSIVEVLFDKGLMDHESLLKILVQQHHSKSGFVEAAKHLKLWTKEIHDQVDKHIVQIKIPLGEILVKSGIVSLDIIADSLDYFLTETKFAPDALHKQINAAPPVVAVVSGSSAAKDLNTYFEQFSLDSYLELKTLLTLSHHKPLSPSIISKVFDSLQLYKGTTRFVGLPKSELVIGHMLKGLEKLIGEDLSMFALEKMNIIEDYELKALDILWQIREELENQKEEDSIIQEFNLAALLEKLGQGVKL